MTKFKQGDRVTILPNRWLDATYNGRPGSVHATTETPNCEFVDVKLDPRGNESIPVMVRVSPGDLRPVLPAPQPAEPESWHGFRNGERVRSIHGWDGTVSGGDSAFVWVLRDDGQRGTGPKGEWRDPAGTLKQLPAPELKAPSAPPPPLGDGDRLHLGDCCRMCGTPGPEACRPCYDALGSFAAWESELARRKQLAEKPAQVTCPGEGGYACNCDKCTIVQRATQPRRLAPAGSSRYPNTGFVPYADRVGLQSLSAPQPDDGPAYENANWPEGSEYWGQG